MSTIHRAKGFHASQGFSCQGDEIIFFLQVKSSSTYKIVILGGATRQVGQQAVAYSVINYVCCNMLGSVLVCQGCDNKIPLTRQPESYRDLVFTILEAGSLISTCHCSQVRALFQATDFSLYLHMVKGLRISLTRALIPFIMVAPP